MQKIIIVVLLSILFIACNKSHKVGYVNIQSVFNNFEYKKELEKELIQIKNNRKFILDSMEANLKIMANKLKLDSKNTNLLAEFQTRKELYLEKKSIFQEEEEDMVRQSDEKIIKQLNSYVKNYGKENLYSIIYGATSNGSIMYGDSALDLSKDITNYINQKYKGK